MPTKKSLPLPPKHRAALPLPHLLLAVRERGQRPLSKFKVSASDDEDDEDDGGQRQDYSGGEESGSEGTAGDEEDRV